MGLPAEVAELIGNVKHICVLTGAGISAESGVPTFRGKEGLWEKFRPEELATPEAFAENPQRVWCWYQYRRDLLANVQPNAGHTALARWESLISDFLVVTQNVDGLHQVAGNRKVCELHGDIRANRCSRCGAESSADAAPVSGQVPLCACGGMLRPGVVWFGEALPEGPLRAAICAAQACDLMVTVGTSALVYPAAALPELALQAGAAVIEINTEETSFTPHATHHLRGSAGEILPELVLLYENMHPELTASAGQL
jgi:NAD-dependent deacetylase